MTGASARIEIVRADIAALQVDAIVNAANSQLIPGGGVDGAINHAAGPALAKAMAAIGHCPTGEAVITPAFKLKAKYVIHTVAPIYSRHPEEEVWQLLANCYRNSLSLAHHHNAHSVAFPSLGTGAYGIPIARACAVAIDEVTQHASTLHHPSRLIFCCYSEKDAAIYRAELDGRNG